VAVVVEDLQAVRGLSEREDDPLVRRQPTEVLTQPLLLAGQRDEQEVVIRPLVGRIVELGRRPDRDEADDPVVGLSTLGQFGGKSAKGGSVDQLTLASRAAYQSSHRSSGAAAV
jgi:hypothetical protein